MESPSRRCNISKSRLYPKYLYEASGGVIKLPGLEEFVGDGKTKGEEKKEAVGLESASQW